MTTVAVLGAGALGSAMAARLGQDGFKVRLWNRTAAKAEEAAAAAVGVEAAGTVAAAVADAAVVLTVLRDGHVVRDVAVELLPAMAEGSVWVQASTVGTEAAHRLRELADDHGVAFLDAPVSGSTPQAQQGALVWLVAGEESVLTQVRPVLDCLGSAVQHVGAASEGSALKLAINTWLASSAVGIANVLGVCDALGVPHATLVDALKAGSLSMPYAFAKIAAADAGEYPAGFPLELALKDVDLTIADAKATGPFVQALRDRLQAGVDAGHGREDVAAVYETEATAYETEAPKGYETEAPKG